MRDPARLFWAGARFAGLLVCLLLVTLSFTCLAAEGILDREAYERDLIARSLAALGLEPEPHPQGKTIERIAIVRKPIIEPSDPWPDFLNVFHVTTREHIVRQELLFKVGQVYNEKLVRESARNLRLLPMLFSTVRIVCARGSKPGGVVVVVITKDLWSLRLNSKFSLVGKVFNYLSLMPSEQNFLGYNQQLSLYTFIDRDTFSLGQIYNVPRLFGTRLTTGESMNLRINHNTNQAEGGFGSLAFGLPLFSLESKWGFSISGSFDIGTSRLYQGAAPLQQCYLLDTSRYCLDWKWNYSYFAAQAQGVRSFGKHYKTNLYFGYRLRSRTSSPTGDFPVVPDEVREAFMEDVLPHSDQAGELVARLVFFEARYARLSNIQTYGLTEDFHLGPQLEAEIDWANPAFGFAQQSLGLSVTAGYRFLLGGHDILALSAALAARYWPGQQDAEALATGTDWVDRRAEIYIENVSPIILGLGRLLARFDYVYSQYSIQNKLLSLGGDNTLRGFTSGFRSGERLFNVNVEFRTVPLVLWTLHWGVVLFYDGGDAYGYRAADDFSYHQSLGLGIRGLFPQFDRQAVRLDFGIPLGKDFDNNVIDWVTLSYRQAF